MGSDDGAGEVKFQTSCVNLNYTNRVICVSWIMQPRSWKHLISFPFFYNSYTVTVYSYEQLEQLEATNLDLASSSSSVILSNMDRFFLQIQ